MAGEALGRLIAASLSGAALTAALVLIRPLTKRFFGYVWRYYIWLAVLAALLLPVRISLPQRVGAPREDTRRVQITAEEAAPEAEKITAVDAPLAAAVTVPLVPRAAERLSRSVGGRESELLLIWLAGAGGFFLMYLLGYLRLLKKMRESSVEIPCPEIRKYTDKNVRVLASGAFSIPFMIGAARPALVLPNRPLTPAQLDNILRHEMTHLRRGDILYKWLAVFAKCVHWFNPAAYYAARQINIECEISCDLAAIKGLDADGEREYVDTILSLLSAAPPCAMPLTTGMAGSKRAIKRRLITMKNKRTTGRVMSAVSAVVAVLMLAATVFASGALADLAAEDYTVEITGGGEKIELANKPFIENGEVYLPLREIFAKMGFADNPENEIRWNDGSITIIIKPMKGTAPNVVTYEYNIQVGKNEITGRRWSHLFGYDDYLTENTWNAPLLRNSVVYVPYEYVDRMLGGKNKFFLQNGIDIDYAVFDRYGAEKTLDVIKGMSRRLLGFEPLKLAPNYSDERTLCYDTIRSLADVLEGGRLESMKPYFTEDFAVTAFNGDAFLGMRLEKIGTVMSIDLYPDGNYYVSFYLYPSSGEEQVFTAVMEIQPDGRALICAMGRRLDVERRGDGFGCDYWPEGSALFYVPMSIVYDDPYGVSLDLRKGCYWLSPKEAEAVTGYRSFRGSGGEKAPKIIFPPNK